MNTGTSKKSVERPYACSDRADETVAVELTEEHRQEVLEFLSLSPFNTIILAGWVLDHGIVSPKHRGSFYGCRNSGGELTGVAMIGRNLLFEARTEEAAIAFGRCARDCSDINMVFAEENMLKKFWHVFRPGVELPTPSRHRLIRSNGSFPVEIGLIDELRLATPEDLDHIVNVHAQIVIDETGVDPLQDDAEGFRSRCAERVEQGRVWVWIKDDRLVFKTDIVSVTPEAIYGEGLWVDPEARGQGFGTRCLASLCHQLSLGSTAFCGFLDTRRPFSASIYSKAGFTEGDEFARIYL